MRGEFRELINRPSYKLPRCNDYELFEMGDPYHQDVKEAAYKTMVRPILEYGSSVWDPYTQGPRDELEKVQTCDRAAWFVTRNYTRDEGSMTGILEQLKWESLKKRRKDNQLILLFKGLKARIRTGDLIPKTRRCRNQHSMAF